MFGFRKPLSMPTAATALPGRATPIRTAETHFVNGHRIDPPFPDGLETAMFGFGCFWGAERKFWELGDGHLRHGGRLCRRPDAKSDL